LAVGALTFALASAGSAVQTAENDLAGVQALRIVPVLLFLLLGLWVEFRPQHLVNPPAASRTQRSGVRGQAAGQIRTVSAPRRRYSFVPYVSIVLTFGLMLAILPRGLGARSWGAVIAVVLITMLVVIRQLNAFADNERLFRELTQHEKRFRALLQHSSDITAITGVGGVVKYVSPAIERILGVPAEEMIGTVWLSRLHPDDRRAAHGLLTALKGEPGRTVTFQARFQPADGSWRWLELFSTNLLEEPSVRGVVSNARDITDARRLRDRLHHQAHHDAVLVAVGQRLRDSFREHDLPARLGGDEFAVLVLDADETMVAKLVERLAALLADPLTIDGQVVPVRASVGSAVGTGATPDDLLRQADAAMYAIKRSRKAAV
jgi:PAS domain S-box-containing protein